MKTITHWLVYALAIAISAYILPGVQVSGFVAVLVLAVVLGAINAFVRPVLIILTLPLSIFTLGLFILAINAFLIMLTSWLVPGFFVNGFLWALVFSIVLSIISAFLGGITKETDRK